MNADATGRARFDGLGEKEALLARLVPVKVWRGLVADATVHGWKRFARKFVLVLGKDACRNALKRVLVVMNGPGFVVVVLVRPPSRGGLRWC